MQVIDECSVGEQQVPGLFSLRSVRTDYGIDRLTLGAQPVGQHDRIYTMAPERRVEVFGLMSVDRVEQVEHGERPREVGWEAFLGQFAIVVTSDPVVLAFCVNARCLLASAQAWRYALGVIPISRRNTWEKWLGLEYPTSNPMSMTLRSVSSNRSRARRMRRRMKY